MVEGEALDKVSGHGPQIVVVADGLPVMYVAAGYRRVADAQKFLTLAEKHPGVFGKWKVFCTIHFNVGRNA